MAKYFTDCIKSLILYSMQKKTILKIFTYLYKPKYNKHIRNTLNEIYKTRKNTRSWYERMKVYNELIQK